MPLAVVTLVDTDSASVRLTITGGSPPYVVDASPTGRDDYRVRSRFATIPGVPSGRVTVDGAIPLNVGTVYTVTDSTGAQVQSTTVTATATQPMLSDSTEPDRALPVVVVRQPPNELTARSVWWDVLDAEAPFVSIAPMRPRHGDVVLYAETYADRRNLVDLIRPGAPMLLRADCPDAVDDVVMLIETARDDLVREDDPTGPRLLTLTYQAVSLELGPYSTEPGRTYADLLAEAGTYADLLVLYVDYAALLDGDPDASLGPELVTDGGFLTVGSPDWSTFWSYGTLNWSGGGSGYVRAEGIAGASSGAVLQSDTVTDLTVVPGATYRISGRVRAVGALLDATVEVLTNTAPAAAQYFTAGTAIQSFGLSESATWVPFVLDATIPAGDDRLTVSFRGDGIGAAPEAIEWTDLSIKAHL